MRILIISPTYEHEHGSGVGVVIKNICEKLTERKHQCRVLTLNRQSSDNVDKLINGVEIKKIGCRWNKYFYGLSPAMYRYIRSAESSWIKPDDVDIINIHMYHNMLSLQLIHQLNNLHKPIVFTPHYNGPGHSFRRNLLLKLYQPAGKYIFRHVNKVICSSGYEASLLLKCIDIADDSLQVIPHGVNLKSIQSRIKQASSNQRISLLFAGRLEEHKGVQFILRAMHLLKSKHQMRPVLDIVGEGKYKEHLSGMVKGLNLEDNVIWSGILPQKDLWEKYKSADIFLLPSRWECYGLVVAEALASGTATIVCNTSALTEFAGEPGCFGIEYPPQPEKLAQLIIDIHRSDVPVGLFNANKIRTWDKVADEYEQLFKELC